MALLQQISQSEMQVMEILWETGEAMTSARIIALLEQNHAWKPSTVWTFLGRLTEKGMVRAEKQGKRSYYTPVISREEYRRAQTRDFLEQVHGGSVKSFFAALGGGSHLEPGELEELKRWLNATAQGEGK